MSRVVTELVIDSDTSGADRFSSSMDKAGASAQQGINSAAGLSLAIAGVGVAFVGALVGLRSFFDYVGQQNKQLIDIAESARNANMTTRDFQQTLFAFQAKGGGTQKDFVTGLDKISTDIAAASSGVTEFGRLFEANGLKIKNANGELKNSKQALADIAGLMQNASPTIQLGIAKIVGLTKEWIPFLRDGVDAIEEQKKAAAGLGIVIDGDVIAKAKEFDKQWKTAIAAWDLQFKASLAGILPLLIQLANVAAIVLNAINAVGGTASRWSTPLDQMSGNQLKEQLSDVEALRTKMLGLKESQDAVAASRKEQGQAEINVDRVLLDMINTKNELQLQNKKSMLLGDSQADLAAADAMIDRIKRLLQFKEKFEELPAINVVGSTVLPANDNKDAVDRAINTLFRHTEAQKADANSMGLGARAHAEFRAQAAMTAAVQANGGKITQEQANTFIWLKLAAGGAAEALERARVATSIDLGKKTAFLSQDDVAIATQLYKLYNGDVPAALASTEAAQIRVTNAQKLLSDGFREVGQSITTAFLTGKNAMAAMMQSLDNLAKKLADKAFDNILQGLLSGNLLQAGVGVAQAGGAALISAFTGDQKKQEELKKARAEWEKAGPAFSAFLKEMSGGVTGNLSQQIQDASAREADFEDKAWKARDSAAIYAARAGLAKFSDTQKLLFQATFQATVDALNDGLGLDSPFMKAVNNVKTALNAQLAFIDDTNVAIGENIPGTMAQVHAASQTYLLSLLQQPRALSAVQTGMMQIHGTANALQGALMQLGQSSADAATAISNGVSKAIASLKTQFEGGLTERLNTANGQSFLNDATKLIQQHQQDLLDAASLGTDPTIVAAVFHAEAQKIVNDAGLVGDAFTAFTKQFPDLAGVVSQATTDMAASAKQLQEASNSAGKSIVDYLTNLQSGPGSTSSPTVTLSSAQQLYNANLALAIGGNVDAQAKFPLLADNLEKAARAVYASSKGYQDIKNQIISQGLGLPAVQNTTDPVVAAMRDVLSAINAAALTQATDATLNGVIKAAIDAGNAQQIAALLVPKFDTLNTTADQGLDFNEFVAGLGPSYSNVAKNTTVAGLLTNTQISALGLSKDATTGALFTNTQLQNAGLSKDTTVGGLLTSAQITALGLSTNSTVGDVRSSIDAMNAGNVLRIFQELDGNGNGLIEKSEAIKVAAVGTNDKAQISIDQVHNNIVLQDAANSLVTSSNSIMTVQKDLLTNIRNLTDTSVEQLTLLSKAFNPALNQTVLTYIIAGAGTSAPSTTHTTFTDQILSVLYKIDVNTWATAGNTRGLAGGAARDGTLASGGLITGRGTGTSDSIPIWASNREFMIRNSAVEKFGVGFFEQLNAGIMPRQIGNDNFRTINVASPIMRGQSNAELIAEIRALRKEVEQLRQENNNGHVGNANAVAGAIGQAAEYTGGKLDDVVKSNEKQTTEIRMGKRNQRSAA